MFTLLLYFCYLLGQIYVAGFSVIKMIFVGAKAYMYTTKTTLQNDTLRIILADSITLTPGSILLEQDSENITVVWLCGSKIPTHTEIDKQIKGRLEDILHKAEVKM